MDTGAGVAPKEERDDKKTDEEKYYQTTDTVNIN